MRHTPQNIFYHNLVGLRVKVLEHPDESLKGLEGLVVNESKNFLWIMDNEGKIRMVEKLGYFEFLLPSGKRVVISGSSVRKRPEERLKKFR